MKKTILTAIPLTSLLLAGSVAMAGGGPTKSVAYINRDTGAATENSSVRKNSGCNSPDRFDRQRRSAEGSSERNVHVDACLFDAANEPFDGTVTFANRGVGAISGCPDPDQVIAQVTQIMNGPKRAYLHDHNGDGRNDHCHQTGYQMKDAAGDDEYHVRVNNDGRAGRERVVFCFDTEQDPDADASGQPKGHGCRDETDDDKSRITIRWR
jgi:hypothetical protein